MSGRSMKAVGGRNQSDLRLMNRAVIFRTIHEKQQISRAELAKLIGLNPATVTHIIRELIHQGLIEEAGSGGTHGGRPSALLRVHPQAGYIIAIHVNQQRLRGMITNLDRSEVRLEKTVDCGLDETREGWEAILPALLALIEGMIAEAGLETGLILGIGISAPHGSRPLASRFQAGEDERRAPSLSERLQEQFELPVFLEQDANAAALAEKCFGAMRDVDHFVLLQGDDGIEAGLLMNGALYRGEHKTAGQIGHMTIDINGPACRCGRQGCLELYASPGGVEHYVRAHLDLKPYSQADELTFEHILRMARREEVVCRLAVERMRQALVVGITNLVNTLDPQSVVLSGRMAAGEDLLLPALQEQVRGNCWIIPSRLGADAPIMGAAALVLRQLFDDPWLLNKRIL